MLGCAHFLKFVHNFSERQILRSLWSVDFHTLTLQLRIQTLHSVVPEIKVFVSSFQNYQNFTKTIRPLVQINNIKITQVMWLGTRLLGLVNFDVHYSNEKKWQILSQNYKLISFHWSISSANYQILPAVIFNMFPSLMLVIKSDMKNDSVP